MSTNHSCARIAMTAVADFAVAALMSSTPAISQQQQGRPNILVIFGDDIGQTNVSAYAHGVVGYLTPNIDRIAREGLMFSRLETQLHIAQSVGPWPPRP